MAGRFPRRNRGRWVLLPGQKIFLAALLFVLLFSYWIRSHSGFLPWQERGDTAPTTPDPFVVEVEGRLVLPGIYTFPAPVQVEEVLLKAGVARELIPRETLPTPLKTGTALLLCQSGQGLRIQTKPMDPTKKILYGIPVDLNEIQIDELTLIPGIGPTLAKRIVRYRDHKGGFTRLDELLNVSGVGRKKLQSLRPYLSVEGNPPSTP